MSSFVGIVPGSGVTPLSLCAARSGICGTLQSLGASDEQLEQVGSGAIQDTDLLNQLTGNYATPADATPQYDIIGLAADALIPGGVPGSSLPTTVSDVSNAAKNAANNATDYLSQLWAKIMAWFKSNWIWIAVVIFVIIAIAAWGFGGFKVGFLG